MADVSAHKPKHAHDGKQAVRFPDGQDDDCNKIHVLRTGDSSNDVEIHAGFFKSDHRYEVMFEVDDIVGLGDAPAVEIPPGVHITLKDARRNGAGNGITLTIEYYPVAMDGIVKEIFAIRSQDGSKEIKGVFRAEVLGPAQGTPMLKDGVKCIQRPHSASSSTSS